MESVKIVRGVAMTPYRIEFERRVKKVIVASSYNPSDREHAGHDLQDCTFAVDMESGTIYSTMSADGPELSASVHGPCRCGVMLRVDAFWPGYDLGRFFQQLTEDDL